METIKSVGPNLKSFYYHVCEPEDSSLVRGGILLLHGTETHGARYEPMAEELVKNGYAVFAIDHIGHGLTLKDKAEDDGSWKKDGLGIWGEDDFDLSTYNAYYLVDVMKKKYPGKPIYLLGDDYGGIMAQYMLMKYENAFDGIIVSGCGMYTGKDLRMYLKSWVKKAFLFDEGKSKGTFRSRTAFLNRRFRPTRTKYDWLNSVPEEVDRFIADPLSGYVGSIGYYYYHYKYIIACPKLFKFKKDYRKGFKKINKNVPMLFIGGLEDSITRSGKTIAKLKAYYDKKGFKNTTVKLYEKSRHDVLLEWNKEQVAQDIASFIDRNSFKEDKTDKKVKNEIKVITVNNFVDSKESTVKKAETVTTFKEEEPEDDLKLSTELKK